jgi:Fe-S cluster assembly protein SufD
VLEDGAALTLLESHANATSFANLGVEFVLGEKAVLTHIRVAQSPAEAVQVEEVAVSQGGGSTYRAHFTDLGAKLSRLELQIALAGAKTETKLSGVHVLTDGRQADVTTRLDHMVGDTESAQLFKHVVGGKSRAVYQGRITVQQGADGTDSRQSAKALLLDERAEADLKPELIIFADDVKCAHGAAVGDIDADSLFYLRSRGIPEAEARAMLMRAFLEDAVSEIENEAIRAAVWSVVEAGLVRAGTDA